MNYKKISAAATALCICASLTACGGGDEGTTTTADSAVTTTEATSWTGDAIEVEELAEDDKLDIDINGQSLKWMGIYDLNPTNDSAERSPELALFEDTYGAKIEYIPTSNDKRFDDLATSILGGDPPDIFVYEWLTFPYGISKGQYQPIDSLVDWEKPKWADVKNTADKFIWNGEHYIAPLGYLR